MPLPQRHPILPSRTTCLWWIGLFVGLNLVWRLIRYATNHPLWGDEAMLAMAFVRRDAWGDFLLGLPYRQLAPPGFLWIVELITRVVGLGEPALRLWPVIAGSLAMLAFARLAWLTVRPTEATLAVAVLAASYFPLRHSVELKPYSTDLLASITMIGLTLWTVRRQTLGRLAVWTVAGASFVWLSFPSIFVSGTMAMWLVLSRLRQRRGSQLLAAFVAGTVVAASFLLLYLVTADTRAAQSDVYRGMAMWANAFPPLDRPWLIPWWLLDTHAGRMLAYPNGGRSFGSTATLLLVVIGGVRLAKTRPRLLLLLLFPAAAGLLAATLGLYPYGRTVRTMLYMAPAICLLTGVGVAWLLRFAGERAKLATTIICLVLVGLIIGSVIGDVGEPYKQRHDLDARLAMEAVAERASPGDTLILLGTEPDPNGYRGDYNVLGRFALAGRQYYAIRNFDGTVGYDAAMPDLSGDLWLVGSVDPLAIVPFDQAIEPLDEALSGYVRIETTLHPAGDFGPLRVDRYRSLDTVTP